VRVKCLAQEHNTMSPTRARTRAALSGNEHTDHYATVPPQFLTKASWYNLLKEASYYADLSFLLEVVISQQGIFYVIAFN